MSALVGDQWKISRAEQIRRALGPDACSAFDALRETFGAPGKLDWLRTPVLSIGIEIESEPIGEKAWHGERKRP